MEILSDATFKGNATFNGKIIAKNNVDVLARNLRLFHFDKDLGSVDGDYVIFEPTEFYYNYGDTVYYRPSLFVSGLGSYQIRVDGPINIHNGYLATPVAKIEKVEITEFVISVDSKFTKYDGNYDGINSSEFRCLTFPRTLTEIYCRGSDPYEIVVNNKLDDALKSLTEFYIQKGTDLSGSYQKKDCSTVFHDRVDIGFDVAASCTKFSVDMPYESSTYAIHGYNVIDLKMTKGSNPISPVNIDLEARCDSTTGNGWKIIATKSSSFAMSSADDYKIHILGVKPY